MTAAGTRGGVAAAQRNMKLRSSHQTKGLFISLHGFIYNLLQTKSYFLQDPDDQSADSAAQHVNNPSKFDPSPDFTSLIHPQSVFFPPTFACEAAAAVTFDPQPSVHPDEAGRGDNLEIPKLYFLRESRRPTPA